MTNTGRMEEIVEPAEDVVLLGLAGVWRVRRRGVDSAGRV
jgi:hypothetical protein